MGRQVPNSKIMLHHLTWQQFLLSAVSVLLLYYTIIWLVYFRRETTNFFTPSEHRHLAPLPDEEYPMDDLLGKAAPEPGVSTIGCDELRLVSAPTDRIEETYYEAPEEDDELYGLIPDVLEEIKLTARAVAMEDGTKADFTSLFKLIPAKYPQIIHSPHLRQVNEWITQNVPFEFRDKELQELWEET